MREIRTGKGWHEELPAERLHPLKQVKEDAFYMIKSTSYDWSNQIMDVYLEEVQVIKSMIKM